MSGLGYLSMVAQSNEPKSPEPPAPPAAPAPPAKAAKAAPQGSSRRVWCAYNADASDFVLFGTEIAALRYMAENHMDGCKPVDFGIPVRDQIK